MTPSQYDEFGTLMAYTTELYHAWAKAHGLNFNSLAVLHCLVRLGQCTQKQVCESWVVPKQTISTICKQFEQEGLIQFIANPHDKREKLMVLTEQGQIFANPIIEQLTQIEENTLKMFGEQRAKHFLNEFRAFVSIFDQQMKK